MISTQNIFNAVEQDTAPTLDCQEVDVGTSADDHHAILIPGCILALSDRAARLGDTRRALDHRYTVRTQHNPLCASLSQDGCNEGMLDRFEGSRD